jgi:hypothetical protein
MPSSATDATTGATESGGGSTGGTLSACAASPEALADCVDMTSYQSDLEFIAELREPGSMHWQEVQDLCADRLTELGYEVQLFQYGSGVDVLGSLPGTMPDAPRVFIGAHYDHIAGCTGADDNATGVAGALEAARVLAEGRYERTLTVACWDEEERGLIGSEAFAVAAADQGIGVEVYFNFEMIGYASSDPDTQRIPPGFDLIFRDEIAAIEANEYRGDFLFVAGGDLSVAAVDSMRAHAMRLELPITAVSLNAAQKSDPLFGDLRRSDHAPFWDQDLPAIFISDSGEFRNDRYHCMGGEDTVDTLVPDFTHKVVQTTVAAAAESLRLQSQ